MPEIKTRERVKDIKKLDKSAVIGQRMKAAYIRSKERGVGKRETEESNPAGYAEDQVQDAINEGGQLGASSAKLAFQRGRDVFQRQRAKKAVKDLRERNAPEAQPIPVEHLTAGVESAPEPAATPTSPGQPVERGRELAKRQAIRRKERSRTAHLGQGQTDIPHRDLVYPVEQSLPLIRQRHAETPPAAVRDEKASSSVLRIVKTPQQTAKAAIKTPQAAEIRRQETVQTVRTAQIAVRTARASAKTAAKKAQHLAKSVAVEVRKAVTAARTSLAALLSGGWVAVLMVVIVVLFGGVLALFGDTAESNAYTPVSAEVEAYTPLIRLYAEQHGIPDFVDLIKAVMMTESGGKGSDPMQASESGYNTRYPRKPNGITDPEYSIHVGVQTLAASIRAAKVESPLDLERIKLCLQGYNFGNGYISWALDKYGGYSEANAIEFSQMMAKKLGWSSYGSTKYPSVVLQYYPFGYKLPTEGDGDYLWPLPGYTRISSPFGYRHCPYHGRELHGGVDLPAPYGTNILAAKGGTVVLSTYGSSFGNHVAVSHPDGSRTMYAHMSARLVSVGDTVVQGQVIGKVGSTGNSTGNHLHFEVWTNGSSSSRVNPMDYF